MERTFMRAALALTDGIEAMRTESYNRVQLEPIELMIKRSTWSPIAEWGSACWKRSRSIWAVCSPKAAKQGRVESAKRKI